MNVLEVLFIQDFSEGTAAAHGDMMSIPSSKFRQKLDNKSNV
jgi:hypothetical protein